MGHNIALLNRVMDYIEGHPERHNQLAWIGEDCGTVACFAGWTVLLHHGVTSYPQAQRYNDEHLPDEATLLLGLTEGQAAWMFDAARTREDLRRAVNAWTTTALDLELATLTTESTVSL